MHGPIVYVLWKISIAITRAINSCMVMYKDQQWTNSANTFIHMYAKRHAYTQQLDVPLFVLGPHRRLPSSDDTRDKPRAITAVACLDCVIRVRSMTHNPGKIRLELCGQLAKPVDVGSVGRPRQLVFHLRHDHWSSVLGKVWTHVSVRVMAEHNSGRFVSDSNVTQEYWRRVGART